MTTARPRISEQTLTTPQAAAYAGILFAILQITSLVLIRASVPDTSTASLEWLKTSGKMVSLAIMLTPFAGIAFLWYMGVIRDRMGRQEDQFFSTLFLGSGLLYLAMTFVASAMASGILNVYTLDPGSVGADNVYVYARAVIYDINNVYGVRMAGMHMLISGTIWIRTGLMPRWLAFVTFLLAAALLLTIDFIPWVTLIFPAWVGIVSVYNLIQNLRSKRKPVLDDALVQDDE